MYIVYREIHGSLELHELGRFDDVQMSGGALICLNDGKVSRLYGVGIWSYVTVTP